MKLNSTTTYLLTAVCLVFAHSAKADCGISTLPQSASNVQTMAAHPTALRAAAPIPEGKAGENGSIVGLWLTTFTSGGQVVDQGFDAWTSDGLEILNDTPPPATGNVCLGAWVKIGPGTFLLKHPSWTFDAAGNVNGTAIIRETVTVQADGNSFKGTFTIDVLDLRGTNLQHLAGTLSGTRITVD